MASEYEQFTAVCANVLALMAEYPGANLMIIHGPSSGGKSVLSLDVARGSTAAEANARYIPGVKDNVGDLGSSVFISVEDASRLFAMHPKTVRHIARCFRVKATKVCFDDGIRKCYDRHELDRAICADHQARGQ
jgi:chloramphenicol 3-O-phosphotransferase